ncbi:collagen alpha-1(I) chain-like [Bos javanicus]|uniref:collagen alpha-1(I) chain-like n=1 Tax=Bos javanicus TaxID=9906 RepID=UPI002AA7C974|nr:collagen alpha-1(I) chain-like [Bos javanicus]
MRPAAPGRRPGGGPPPAPPPAPPAHPREPPRRPPPPGDGGESVLFNFPLRYLLTIGLVPQPDSGKTRARRAGGRYRPHTVHGLGLDQKDLGPPRAAPGKAARVGEGAGRGTHGRRSPNGRRTHRAPPTTPLSPRYRHRHRPRGGSSGARTAARPQPGGRARSGGQTPRRPAGRRRGTRPRGADAHADSASGASRPSRRGASRVGGGKRARAAGTRRERHRRGKAGGGGPRRPGAGKHHRQGRDGERRRTGGRDPTPATTAGPRRVARDRPQPPDTPGAVTPEGRLRREEALEGETDHTGPGRPGASARAHVPFSPLSRATSPRPQRRGGGDAVSALRGTEGPEALRGQPPATRPPGRRAQDTRTPEGAIDRQATLRQADAGQRAHAPPHTATAHTTAVGYLERVRRARGTARPTGQRPDVDPQPPRPPTGPAAARGPRRRRPVTAGGAPPRAGRPPAPEGPADARRPPPRRPPRDAGQSPPPPLQPSHTRCGRPRRTPSSRPSPSAGGGPYPNPRSRAPFPPHTTTEGGGKGLRRGAGRQAGRGHASEVRERRKQGGRTGQTAAGGVGGGGRGGRKPRGSEGVGRRGAWRPARQAQSGRRTAGRRPAQGRRREAAGQGKRPRDGEPPPATPHSPPDATGGSAPRGSAALVGGGSRGRRHGRKARGVGWGRGELAEPTPSPPHPRTLGANLEGRGGEGRAIGKRGRTPEGDATGRGAGWRGAPGRVGGNGGAEGPAAGGGARAGKQAEENPPLPTRYPPQLCHAAPPTSLARLLAPQTHRGVAPNRPPTARGGRGALRTRLALPLSPPPGPIPRRTGGGEAREPGAGRGEAPAPLSEPTALMILPQPARPGGDSTTAKATPRTADARPRRPAVTPAPEGRGTPAGEDTATGPRWHATAATDRRRRNGQRIGTAAGPEARHTGARPREAADGERTEADGQTERGTDGGEARVGRRGPPRDLTAGGLPAQGRSHRTPGTTDWRPPGTLTGAHAHRHRHTPESRKPARENALPPRTGGPHVPHTRKAPRAPPRLGDATGRRRPGDDTHMRSVFRSKSATPRLDIPGITLSSEAAPTVTARRHRLRLVGRGRAR